jgi:hypothetical protein
VISLASMANDVDGTNLVVKFLSGTNLLAQFTNGPYSFIWSNAVSRDLCADRHRYGQRRRLKNQCRGERDGQTNQFPTVTSRLQRMGRFISIP